MGRTATTRDGPPRPIGEIRARNYRDVEPGVRDFVRQLDEAGYIPVWSCEGHRKYDLPPTWHDGPVWRRLTKAGIAWWRKPRVICAGKWDVDRRRLGIRGVRFLASDVRIVRPGCSILRAIHDADGRAEDMGWTMFVVLGEMQLSRATRALDGRRSYYARIP